MTKRNILIIDDDKEYLKFMKDAIPKQDFTVIETTDGIDGIRKAKDFKPDIIILSLDLKGIQGEELLRLIRMEDNLKTTPIIITSINSINFDAFKHSTLKPQGFLKKPFNDETFLSTLQNFLGFKITDDDLIDLQEKFTELIVERANIERQLRDTIKERDNLLLRIKELETLSNNKNKSEKNKDIIQKLKGLVNLIEEIIDEIEKK